jgi:hypothetical protein
MKAHFLYVVTWTGFAKIGVTTRPSARLSGIRQALPCNVESFRSVAVIAGLTKRTERALLRKFSSYAANGEWLRCEGEVADFVMRAGKADTTKDVTDLLSYFGCYIGEQGTPEVEAIRSGMLSGFTISQGIDNPIRRMPTSARAEYLKKQAEAHPLCRRLEPSTPVNLSSEPYSLRPWAELLPRSDRREGTTG